MAEAADGRLSGVSKELRAAETLCFPDELGGGGELTVAVTFFFSEEEEI